MADKKRFFTKDDFFKGLQNTLGTAKPNMFDRLRQSIRTKRLPKTR